MFCIWIWIWFHGFFFVSISIRLNISTILFFFNKDGYLFVISKTHHILECTFRMIDIWFIADKKQWKRWQLPISTVIILRICTDFAEQFFEIINKTRDKKQLETFSTCVRESRASYFNIRRQAYITCSLQFQMNANTESIKHILALQ